MAIEFLCRKIGMTKIYNDAGNSIPVTVLEAAPNTIVQKKTEEKDKYSALQLGTGEKREKLFSKAELGHFKSKDVSPKRTLGESRIDASVAEEYEAGQEIGIDHFAVGEKVDVIGNSKGRGFTGVVKRHGFKINKRTHGTHESFRHGGSIGAGATPGKVIKGKKMAGQQGNARVTVSNLEVVRIDAERNLLFVQGGVPGHRDGVVKVRHSHSAK